MLDIESVNHVGIRVADKARSIAFYESLTHGYVRSWPKADIR